jgi:hypothetical protein
MSSSNRLKDRARRQGTASIYAGSEPRPDELVAHWPKHKKVKRHRFRLPRSKAKRLRKEKIIKHADASSYQARLTAPWPLHVCASKGGSTE